MEVDRVSIVDELQKLEDLRRSGSLTDEEFAQAKATVLAGPTSSTDEPIGQHLSEQLTEVRYQNELARVDREWEIERQRFYITNRYGARQLPTTGMGIGIATVGGIFGLFWTIMAVSITGTGPDAGAFGVVSVVFPLFGVLFIVGAIAFGIYCYSRAQEYQKALAEYHSRREAIQPE